MKYELAISLSLLLAGCGSSPNEVVANVQGTAQAAISQLCNPTMSIQPNEACQALGPNPFNPRSPQDVVGQTGAGDMITNAYLIDPSYFQNYAHLRELYNTLSPFVAYGIQFMDKQGQLQNPEVPYLVMDPNDPQLNDHLGQMITAAQNDGYGVIIEVGSSYSISPLETAAFEGSQGRNTLVIGVERYWENRPSDYTVSNPEYRLPPNLPRIQSGTSPLAVYYPTEFGSVKDQIPQGIQRIQMVAPSVYGVDDVLPGALELQPQEIIFFIPLKDPYHDFDNYKNKMSENGYSVDIRILTIKQLKYIYGITQSLSFYDPNIEVVVLKGTKQ